MKVIDLIKILEQLPETLECYITTSVAPLTLLEVVDIEVDKCVLSDKYTPEYTSDNEDISAEDWIPYTEGSEVYRDGQALFHTPDGRTFTDAREADKHIQQLWMQKEKEEE